VDGRHEAGHDDRGKTIIRVSGLPARRGASPRAGQRPDPFAAAGM